MGLSVKNPVSHWHKLPLMISCLKGAKHLLSLLMYASINDSAGLRHLIYANGSLSQQSPKSIFVYKYFLDSSYDFI